MIHIFKSNTDGTHAAVTQAGSGAWQSRSNCRNALFKVHKMLLQSANKNFRNCGISLSIDLIEEFVLQHLTQGGVLVSGSLDMTVRVWDLATGTQVFFNTIQQLEFSTSSSPSPSLLSPSSGIVNYKFVQNI